MSWRASLPGPIINRDHLPQRKGYYVLLSLPLLQVENTQIWRERAHLCTHLNYVALVVRLWEQRELQVSER
jgi:hypothetical protein